MSQLTDYAEAALLDHVFGTSSYTPVSTLYMGYGWSAADDGTVTETGAGNYARKAITFGAASSMTISNSADVEFNRPAGTEGGNDTWMVFDAVTSGNLLAYGTISPTRSPTTQEWIRIKTGDVQISFNGHSGNVGISQYLANALLDFMFRNQSYSAPTPYIGFSTTSFTETSSVNPDSNEISGGGYARVSHTSWNAATGTTPTLVDNNGAITFSVTGTWSGSPTSLFIADASTGGNLLFFGQYAFGGTPSSGTSDTVVILSGELDITME